MKLVTKIKVMQAAEEGETIQWCKDNDLGNGWKDVDINYISWDWNHHAYRIKPQPKEIWVNEYKNHSGFHNTKEAAIGVAGFRVIRRAVHYREVL